MRAAVFREMSKPLAIETIADPTPGAHELILRVKNCGICGSDLHMTSGSPFEERVWTLLGEIPYGQTTSYGALAGQLGDRALAQEVGRAVGRNPLSVIVPCHRVLGAGGKLTGYAGGLARKRSLLELEGAIAPEPVPAAALF